MNEAIKFTSKGKNTNEEEEDIQRGKFYIEFLLKSMKMMFGFPILVIIKK